MVRRWQLNLAVADVSRKSRVTARRRRCQRTVTSPIERDGERLSPVRSSCLAVERGSRRGAYPRQDEVDPLLNGAVPHMASTRAASLHRRRPGARRAARGPGRSPRGCTAPSSRPARPDAPVASTGRSACRSGSPRGTTPLRRRPAASRIAPRQFARDCRPAKTPPARRCRCGRCAGAPAAAAWSP